MKLKYMISKIAPLLFFVGITLIQAQTSTEAIHSILGATSSNFPTVHDYQNAGIKGVGTHNIDGINEKLVTYSVTQRDSKVEIQGIVDEYNTMITSVMSIVTHLILSEEKKIEIAGTPKNVSNLYDIYQFKPEVVNPYHRPLVYSIQNKPSWAEFDKSTGLLEGIPSADDEGEYANIVISVSDGTNTASLTPFTITVNPATNIALAFGKATQPPQNGYNYYYEPSLAIDGNLSTFNHTQGDPNLNWWQLALPSGTKIHKIVIHNRASNTGRLNGAKVYITNDNYIGTLPSNSIATLKSDLTQMINLSTPVVGKYLLIKASGDNNLHMSEVEVYGETPKAPHFNEHDNSYTIPYNTLVGSLIATISGIDYQGDTLSYSIDNNDFAIDNQGNITLQNSIAAGEHPITVTVSDGINDTTTDITIVITDANAIEEALKSGSIDKVTEKELLQATLDEIKSYKATNAIVKGVFANSSIDYEPTYNSQLFIIKGDKKETVPLIFTDQNNTLAVAGTKGEGKFALFGTNPITNSNISDSFDAVMKRVLYWLAGGLPIDEGVKEQNKTIGLGLFSNVDAGAIKEWLEQNIPNWTLQECSDKSSFATCISSVDIAIIGRNGDDSDGAALKDGLDQIFESGKSALYLHPDWSQNSISDAIESYFEVEFPYTANWWKKDKAIYKSADAMWSDFYNSEYASLEKVLWHFKARDFSFDWSKCKNSKGVYGEDFEDCSEVPNLNSDFYDGASYMKKTLNSLDSSKRDIFQPDGYRLEKLLVLLSDKFRQSVSYPMDKVRSDMNDFMRSLFADHAVYNYRKTAPKQPDMGNFSRSDFSHIAPTQREVTIVSKSPFRATGAYALPGETFKVTREDNNTNLTVNIQVNTLRAGATHEYRKNGYKRPKYLTSTAIEIKPYETIYMTSVYGGVIEARFDKNDINTTLKFEQVGEHPFWAFWDEESKATFKSKLEANEYDWAEVSTSAFEVHSKKDKMIESINNFRWDGVLDTFVQAIRTYASSNPMSLAGYKGPGIEVIDEVKNWADNKNIPIENTDFVKHMNADQALCGTGCSGNPYDAYWAFDPISHGDIHEVGHSLERALFLAEGWERHASTNFYAYYTQTRYNKYIEQNSNITDKERYYITNNHVGVSVFKTTFDAIKNAPTDTKQNRIDYLKTNLWDSSNYSGQSLFWIEAMMYAQKYATGEYALQDGWHLLTRVHVLEKYLRKIKTADKWDDNKVKIGFGNYSLDEVKDITSNDWMLVSISYASGLDFRNFFDMYGIAYSDKASQQVESFEFVPTKYLFFAQEGNSDFILPNADANRGYLNQTEVEVHATSVYPY